MLYKQFDYNPARLDGGASRVRQSFKPPEVKADPHCPSVVVGRFSELKRALAARSLMSPEALELEVELNKGTVVDCVPSDPYNTEALRKARGIRAAQREKRLYYDDRLHAEHSTGESLMASEDVE